MLFDFNECLNDTGYKFDAFELRVGRRLLTQFGKPVHLGSRALDILGVLVARAGEIVSNEAIIAQVWPTTFVDEANLRVQIGRLRKALGDRQDGARYIVNVPVRGYCFVAPVANSRRTSASHPLTDAGRSRDAHGAFTNVQA